MLIHDQLLFLLGCDTKLSSMVDNIVTGSRNGKLCLIRGFKVFYKQHIIMLLRKYTRKL